MCRRLRPAEGTEGSLWGARLLLLGGRVSALRPASPTLPRCHCDARSASRSRPACLWPAVAFRAPFLLLHLCLLCAHRERLEYSETGLTRGRVSVGPRYCLIHFCVPSP